MWGPSYEVEKWRVFDTLLSLTLPMDSGKGPSPKPCYRTFGLFPQCKKGSSRVKDGMSQTVHGQYEPFDLTAHSQQYTVRSQGSYCQTFNRTYGKCNGIQSKYMSKTVP